MTSEHELRFVTWNTDGIKSTSKSPEKLSEFLAVLNKLNADIVFMQETHVGPKSYHQFYSDEIKETWDSFFTVHLPNSKGVAILVKKSLQFKYICHDEDYNGGYLALFCSLYDELFTLVNVYNHNNDRIVLRRLKEYLIETAEGVLVVGGDFNTVLHPSLDRAQSNRTLNVRHSPLRALLEDFYMSLNLKDTWSYLYPTEEGFTWHQGNSYSRLDMFFMPEKKMNRLCSITPHEQHAISDHYPLVLTLKVQTEQTKNKQTPSVAKMLLEQKYIPDERAGKISGAEILSAIKSFPNSEENRHELSDYRQDPRAQTEKLKEQFNNMLKTGCISPSFKQEGHNFTTDYLIFTQTLANRLSLYNTPSFERTIRKNLQLKLKLTFATGLQEISWSFLEEALQNLEQIPNYPIPDFSILDSILPKVKGSDNLRLLQPDCPLTNTILNLALKRLQDLAFRCRCDKVGHTAEKKHKHKCKEIMSMVSVCYQRRVLLMYIHLNEHEAEKKVNDFKQQVETSGIKMWKET